MQNFYHKCLCMYSSKEHQRKTLLLNLLLLPGFLIHLLPKCSPNLFEPKLMACWLNGQQEGTRSAVCWLTWPVVAKILRAIS